MGYFFDTERFFRVWYAIWYTRRNLLLYLVKKNKIYYLRIRIPKDVAQHFPTPEIKKSLHTSSYKQAAPIAKIFVAEAEKVFMMIRSNTLTSPQIHKIIDQLLDRRLSKYDEDVANRMNDENYDNILRYAEEKCDKNIKKNKELLSRNKSVEANHDQAFEILKNNGIEIDKESPEFNQFCKELVRSTITQYEVIKSRIKGEEHPYELILREKHRSNTLQEVMDSYIHRCDKVIKTRSRAKLPEKFKKILECFEYETGEADILLSSIDYDLTLKVATRLSKYPSYRFNRYTGKSLDEIYALKDVEYSSHTTVSEEINLISSLYQLAIDHFNGLDRNHASGMSKVILGKSNNKESEIRDIFRPEDIQEIISALLKFKLKFNQLPHLYLIPLIALYSGMRVNEICQLYLDDIKKVGDLWCFDNNENHFGKSIKNANSKRINPIHPDLIKIGLIEFCDNQKKKGYVRLWEGVNKVSCDYYERQSNYSHYFDKWFNGTFKKHLKLSNPAKQTFHSFRHTFIDWYKQNNESIEHWEAITALSGHLDEDDMRIFGIDSRSESRKRYSKELSVKKQFETLKLLDYGIDIKPLKI